MENEISFKVIGAAIEVHRNLGGPSLLESIYESALFYELTLQNLKVQRQLAIPIEYKGMTIRDPLKLDLLVEKRVAVEIKATHHEHTIYKAQLLTYLRLANIKLGLLINFGQDQIRHGITRVVNKL